MIPHDNAGLGLYVSQNIGVGKVGWYYYGSLINANLNKRWQNTKTYGEGRIQVPSKRSRSRLKTDWSR